MNAKALVVILIICVAWTAGSVRGAVGILEAFPGRFQARIEHKQQLIRNLPPQNGLRPSFVIQVSRRWSPGETVTVAFNGGDAALRQDVMSRAFTWTKYGNINLNFGTNAADGMHFREWKITDQTYTADVRISFDAQGYWSFVGTDAIDKSITKPSEPSMNLQGFDKRRPSDWTTVVLHEFGHALGFQHEHQSPEGGCESELRWENDLGYVDTQDLDTGEYIPDSKGHNPGIYTVLGGYPNFWQRAVVDFNLRKIANSSAIVVGPFDPKSIMMYSFPGWMFVQGTNSPCCTDENIVLSPQDIAGMGKVYPRTAADVGKIVRSQREALNLLLKSDNEDIRTMSRRRLNSVDRLQ